MTASLLRRLVRRLHTCGKRVYPRNFLKAMHQAEVAHAPFHNPHIFRPRLEVLEDRLAPTVSFAAQATFATGSEPTGVAVADLNGDGKPDLISANYSDGTVSVFMNTTANGAAAPTFGAQEIFAVGAGPTQVAVADLNGDGLPDIVVTDYASRTNTVSILVNDTLPGATAPSFLPQQTVFSGFATGPARVALADLNGDSRPDIIIGNYSSGTVSVLMNLTQSGNTNVAFNKKPETFAVGSEPLGISVGDLNGDGRPDLVVANYGSASVSVLLNTTQNGAAAASFAAQQTFAVGSGAADVELADFNGDGRADLAVSNENDGTVSTLLNTTAAGATAVSFGAQQTFSVSGGPFQIAVGDFSGDGRPDLAIANGDSVSVLENTTPFGATAASFAAEQILEAGSDPSWLAAADLNADGRTDLAVTNFSSDTLSVYLNNLPTTASTITYPVEVGNFTHYGVDMFNHTSNSWAPLSPFDPNVLAANDNGEVVENLPGYGVQFHRPGASSWVQLTPTAATALAIDPMGDIVGYFPEYGVYYYRQANPGSWTLLSSDAASEVALDAYGNVIASFTGKGVGIEEYLFARPPWTMLNQMAPTTFAVNSLDEIVASFSNLGVEEYVGSWTSLTKSTATSVAINNYGFMLATFAPYGVDVIPPNVGTAPFSTITPTDGNLLALDNYGHAYGTFSGYGTFAYQPLTTSWARQTPTTAALLSVADYPFDLSSPF